MCIYALIFYRNIYYITYKKYNVKFILSVSRDESRLPECAKAKIVISL
jgi:hypothetical protein